MKFRLDLLDDYLIDGWNKAYKMYSTWFFIIIGALPDIYNQAIASQVIQADAVPVVFSRIINMIAFAGLTSRLLKQKRVEKDAEDAVARREQKERESSGDSPQ